MDAAIHADFHQYLDAESTQYAKTEKWLADMAAKEKEAFVERMKAARLAKRQAKAGDAVEPQLMPEATG